MLRQTVCAMLLTLVVQLHAAAQDTDVKRLSKNRPDSGPFVETDLGFMLPYTAKITGTNVSFEMVPIPGGKLQRELLNGRQVVIAIDPCWIGKHEVTWQEYAGFMALYQRFKSTRSAPRPHQTIPLDQVDAVTAPTVVYDNSLLFEFATRPNCPATGMSQFAARQYTKWLSILLHDCYRLPSEAEWTYACLAPSDELASFPQVNIEPSVLEETAVFASAEGGPLQVGSRNANAFGLFDVLGNVSEWVLDSHTQGSSIMNLEAGHYTVEKSVHRARTRWAALACGGCCWDEAEACQPMSRVVGDEDLWNEDPDYPPSISWTANFDHEYAIGFRILRPLCPQPIEKQQVYWLPDSEELRFDVEEKIKYWRGVTGVVEATAINWDDLGFPFVSPEAFDKAP